MEEHSRTDESAQKGVEESALFAHLHALRDTVKHAGNLERQHATRRLWMALREKLFFRYENLIPHIIKKRGLHVIDDLIQDGSIVLLRAIDAADPELLEKNNSFETFACTCLWNHFCHEGKNTQKRWLPTMSADLPRAMPLAFPTHRRRIPGLDDPDPGVHIWHNTTLGDSLLSNDPLPEKEVIEQDTQKYVIKLLKYLSQRDANVLQRWYGIGENEPESLRDIGDDLGLSHEYIRQIRDRALLRLQNITKLQSSRHNAAEKLNEAR